MRLNILPIAHRTSHDDVRVAVDVLGDRVDDDVSAERERSLQYITFSS